MPTGDLRVSSSLTIPETELTWRFSSSGGPGGQHANRSSTRVELVFDVEASAVLGPRQRARLLAALGPRVRVVASDERSQLRNRELALERLQARLRAALSTPRRRVPTAPSRAAQERRLREKREHGERKARRQAGPED